jgi:hypothetical protein
MYFKRVHTLCPPIVCSRCPIVAANQNFVRLSSSSRRRQSKCAIRRCEYELKTFVEHPVYNMRYAQTVDVNAVLYASCTSYVAAAPFTDQHVAVRHRQHNTCRYSRDRRIYFVPDDNGIARDYRPSPAGVQQCNISFYITCTTTIRIIHGATFLLLSRSFSCPRRRTV